MIPSDSVMFSTVLAILVIFAQACIAVLLLGLLTSNKRIINFFGRRAFMLAAIVACTAVIGSVTYSDVFNMAPCKLCWYQRIFIFPQAVLLLVALFNKYRTEVATYIITFATIAIGISIFHYLLQMTDAPAISALAPCDVTGQAPSCSSFYVLMFGYITIPMMAMTVSASTLLLMVTYRKFQRAQK